MPSRYNKFSLLSSSQTGHCKKQGEFRGQFIPVNKVGDKIQIIGKRGLRRR
jgi:hypothetical protein